MQKWEHRAETVQFTTIQGAKEAIQELLWKNENDGWELVAATADGYREFLYFKRPAQS